MAAQRNLPDWLTTRPIAHRGLHDNQAGVPENSRAAIEACVAAGCPVELDVRLTVDGQLILLHDWTLERMTGQTGRVAHWRAAELEKLTLCSTTERILSLTEALKAIGGQIPLLLEIKCETPPVAPVTNAVRHELRGYKGPFAVQSFNPFVLRCLRRLAPDVPLGLLSAWRFAGLTARWARADFLCQRVDRLHDLSAQRARQAGMPLLAWVVRDDQTRQTAARLADNYIFEEVRYQKSVARSAF